MSLCNLPTLSFSYSLPPIPGFSLPSIPVITLAFSLPCPID